MKDPVIESKEHPLHVRPLRDSVYDADSQLKVARLTMERRRRDYQWCVVGMKLVGTPPEGVEGPVLSYRVADLPDLLAGKPPKAKRTAPPGARRPWRERSLMTKGGVND